MEELQFASLLGKTLTAIVVSDDRERIDITTADGESFRLYHDQDCCESVSVDDITGDLADLTGSPITRAEEATSDLPPHDKVFDYEPESQTWTFYKLGTVKGSVDIRWFGSSNGYYSERVSFVKD